MYQYLFTGYTNVLSDHLLVAFALTAQPKSLKGDDLDTFGQVVVSVLAWHLCMNSFHVAHLCYMCLLAMCWLEYKLTMFLFPPAPYC